MNPVRTLACLAVAAIALAPVPSFAQEKATVEDLKEVPSELKSFMPRSATGAPALASVFFFEPGTTVNAQSVPAGKNFDMVVFLNQTATADVQVTVTAFRLDPAGLKLIPIVAGRGDDKYWATAPTSPVTIRNGYLGVRIPGVQVLRNAKQPPDGDITKPFEPVKFPDHVIMVLKQGEVVLAPTLRIAKP